MAIPVKAILIEPEYRGGYGLTAIRELESQAVDVSEFDTSNALSDPTCCSGAYGYIIKNNKVYRIMKAYMDVDKNVRWLLCKNDTRSLDIV